MYHVIVFLLGMVAVQSLLFSFYLLRSGKKDSKTKLLGIFMLIIGLHFINLVLGRTVQAYEWYGLSWVFLSSYGPFIYVYTRLFLDRDGKFLFLNLLLPAYPVMLWLFTNELHRESSIDLYVNMHVSLPIYGSLLLYLLLSAYELVKGNSNVQNLKWLKYLIVSFLVLAVSHLSVLFFYSSGSELFGHGLYLFEIVYMFFFVSGMVYTAATNPVLFMGAKKIINTLPKLPKYYHTRLDSFEAGRILKEIEALMETDKPYQDPEFTLARMSDRLGIPKRHISQVINEMRNKNFNDFINEYRISEALELLRNKEEELRIFEIMYDVGFNSKSSFNIAFKRFTGQTPTKFKQGLS